MRIPVRTTRRQLLAAFTATATAARSAETNHQDPALRLWAQWEWAREQHQSALKQLDRLEAVLLKQIGYPRVRIRSENSERKQAIYATDEATIVRLLGTGPRREALRSRLIAELRQHQQRWAAASAATGHAAALVCEAEAADQVEALGRQTEMVSATTLAGVMAKIIITIEMYSASPSEILQPPWSILKSVLRDLSSMEK